MKKSRLVKKKYLSGYLTVFMVLCLSSLLILVFTLMRGARQNTVRTEAEIVMDVAGQSALAEYHREMWKQYGMLFIDTSYGREQPETEFLSEQMRFYMSENFSNMSLMDISVEDVEVLDFITATDNDGEAFCQAAVNYIEEIAGIKNLNTHMANYNLWNEKKHSQYDAEKDRKENQEKIDNHPVPVRIKKKQKYDAEKKKAVTVEEREEVPIRNPADAINAQRKKGVLNLVLDKTDYISEAQIIKNKYISSREPVMSGQNTIEERNRETKYGGYPRTALFQIFVFDKMGYWNKEYEKSDMKYQAEYILYGNNSDLKNLQAAVSRLLLFREVSNLLFLNENPAKKAEIESMAAGVAAVAVSPDLYPLLKTSITFGWAFLESIQDVKNLMHGGKVPVWKTDKTWTTELSSILDPQNIRTENHSENGLNYQEYLYILMLLQNHREKVFRTMDIVEMDIRKTPGNENFGIDGCVSNFRGRASVMDQNGYFCSITRDYGY